MIFNYRLPLHITLEAFILGRVHGAVWLSANHRNSRSLWGLIILCLHSLVICLDIRLLTIFIHFERLYCFMFINVFILNERMLFNFIVNINDVVVVLKLFYLLAGPNLLYFDAFFEISLIIQYLFKLHFVCHWCLTMSSISFWVSRLYIVSHKIHSTFRLLNS